MMKNSVFCMIFRWKAWKIRVLVFLMIFCFYDEKQCVLHDFSLEALKIVVFSVFSECFFRFRLISVFSIENMNILFIIKTIDFVENQSLLAFWEPIICLWRAWLHTGKRDLFKPKTCIISFIVQSSIDCGAPGFWPGSSSKFRVGDGKED